MSAWLPALRIARREARRAKGRSALVIAMIAVPALCLTFAAATYDMFKLTPAEQVTRELGAADGRIRWLYDGPAYQTFDALGSGSEHAQPKGGVTEAELVAALPPGSRVIPALDGIVSMRTPTGVGNLNARGLDVADPLAAGMVAVLDGRAPATADEVALTEKGVDRLGSRIGGTIELADGSRRYTVTGVVEFPANLLATVVFRPEAVPPGVADTKNPYARSWLVDTPEPLTWAAVRKLNEKGMIAASRDVTLKPPPDSELDRRFSGDAGIVVVEQVAVGVLIFGLGVLEVVLLAGPAFAVGARRRQRQLALVAADGGTPAHVRRIVLADGVVLGVVAAGAGILLGIAVAFAGRPLVEEHLAQARAGGYRVFPLALLAIGGLAVLTGVLGALVPAFVAARQDVIAALAGRRGITRSRKRWVFVGLGMCGLGAALAGYGAWTVNTNVVLAGLVIGELGVVLCTPALVGLIARLGRFLPVAPRIALRDTARNRAAAAPAISAVMAAVAGAVAIGVYLGSEDLQRVMTYHASLPTGYVSAGVRPDHPTQQGSEAAGDGPSAPPVDALRAAVRDTMPVARMVDVYGVGCAPGEDRVDGSVTCSVGATIPEENRCPYFGRPGPLSRAEQRAARQDRRCDMDGLGWSHGDQFNTVVDDGAALPILTGAPAEQIAEATAVLRAGGVVVQNDLLLSDGKVTLRVDTFQVSRSGAGSSVRGQEPVGREITLPGYVLSGAKAGPGIVVSPGAVQRLGLTRQWAGVVASTTRTPTRAEGERLSATAADHQGWAYVERGHRRQPNPQLLILALAAGVITLGAAGVATGLAAADGRADLSTLAAVGASPRLRRMLSLSQSGVIAGLGALLGAAAGLGAATAILFALNQVYASVWPAPMPYPIMVPWASLGIVVVVVPLVAMLGAGLLTRSRLPIERRLAG